MQLQPLPSIPMAIAMALIGPITRFRRITATGHIRIITDLIPTFMAGIITLFLARFTTPRSPCTRIIMPILITATIVNSG